MRKERTGNKYRRLKLLLSSLESTSSCHPIVFQHFLEYFQDGPLEILPGVTDRAGITSIPTRIPIQRFNEQASSLFRKLENEPLGVKSAADGSAVRKRAAAFKRQTLSLPKFTPRVEGHRRCTASREGMPFFIVPQILYLF